MSEVKSLHGSKRRHIETAKRFSLIATVALPAAMGAAFWDIRLLGMLSVFLLIFAAGGALTLSLGYITKSNADRSPG